MPTYTRAKQAVTEFVRCVLEDYHPALTAVEVTVSVLLVHPTEKDIEKGEAPYLKLHGCPTPALARATPYEKRVQGLEDLTLKLDRVTYESLPEEERAAMIDHALTSVQLVVDREGELQYDDHGRPRLKPRPPDWFLSGYALVAARHGGAAREVQEFHRVSENFRQQLFSFIENVVEQDPVPDAAETIG